MQSADKTNFFTYEEKAYLFFSEKFIVDWKKVLEELPAGVAILDENFNVLMVNKRIEDKTGLATKHFKNPLNSVHPEDLLFVREIFDKLRKGEFDKIPYPILVRVIRKGGYQWNEIRWKFVEDKGRKYYLLTFTDVTKRVELQKRLESLLDYAKLLNSILRHDMMNNLTSIISYSEILEEKVEEDAEKKFIEKINKTAWRGVNLINKIKELEGSMGEELKSYTLSEVIGDLAKGSEVELKLEGDAVILANEGIYTVFENLFSNSVKHGGASRIFVRIEETSDKVIVEFQDNGRGVPLEIMDRIFEKGFSTSNSTGLGLYIVKKLVESYGGKIRLEDPKGAKFVIEFPKMEI